MPPLALGIGTAIAGIAGAAGASHSSSKATDAQTAENKRADDIQQQANDRAYSLGLDQQNYERWLQSATATARQPYLDAFSSALGAGGGSGYAPQAYTPGTFTAPTQAQAENDPGYQFALSQGNQGIEHSASARGTLLTGGTAKDLALFNQDAASSQYDKVYGRAYNEFQTGESNKFNATQVNNQSAYNAASLGLQGYGQRLSALGTLASLASPGAYPGSTGGASTGQGGMPSPVVAPGQEYALPTPGGKTDTPNQNYTPSVLGRVSY